MAVTNIHTLERIDVTGSGAFALSQLTTRSVDPAIQETLGFGAGQASPSHAAIMSQAPMVSCSTTEIARALANIDALVGMEIPQTTVITGLDAYFLKTVDAGTRATGSNHFKVSVAKGLAVPTNLSVDLDGEAALGIDVHAIDDGSSAVLAFADSQALPAGTPTVDEKFTLGPAWINGTQVDGVIGLNVDFGIAVQKLKSDGQVFPSYSFIATVQPTIRIQTNDVLNLNTFGLSGTAQGMTASDIYLQKIAANSTRVAIATVEHVRIRVNASQGMITVNEQGGGNNEPTTGEIMIRPLVGSAAVITVATAVAIPTFS